MNKTPNSFFPDDGNFDEDAETEIPPSASPSASFRPQSTNFIPSSNSAPKQYDQSTMPTDLGNNGYTTAGLDGNYRDPMTRMPAGHQDVNAGTIMDTGEMPVPALGFLIVKRPAERRGYVHVIKGNATIGRKAGQIILADNRVSEYHANIRMGEPENGTPTFWIADMNSLNGTRLNNEKIEGKTRLNENDEIIIGGTTFIFKILKD